MPAKGENQGTKRRKINDKEFVTIQENWGHPTTTCSQKNKKEQESMETQQPNKRNRTSENNTGIQLTNLRRIENKMIEVDETDQNLEWEQIKTRFIQTRLNILFILHMNICILRVEGNDYPRCYNI